MIKVEKVFKREDGSRVIVHMQLQSGWHSDEIRWIIEVSVVAKGKRKPFFRNMAPNAFDCGEYRCLDSEQKRLYRKREVLKYVSEEELEQVRNILMQKLKETDVWGNI